MRTFIRQMLVAGCAILAPSTCLAQHFGDIVVSLDAEQRLVGAPQISTNILEDFFGTLFQNAPGFDSLSGTFQDGDELGFNVMERLLFTTDGLPDSPPAGEVLTISKGPLALDVDGSERFFDGFIFGKSGQSGSIHEHVEFELSAAAEPTPGAYGLLLELQSPSYESSKPFLIVFGVLDGDFVELEQLTTARDWLTVYALPIAGDVDRDGDVDLDDFTTLKNGFGESVKSREEGDLTGDGTIDLDDFTELKANFGALHSALPTQAVPEPSSVLIAALGCFFALLHRRR